MAGRIPQHFINDLLARVDIVELIGSRVALKKAGRNHQGLCPFHNEKTPSFTVSPDKQFYHCFGCRASGTALTFLIEYERLEFVEAVEALARTVGVEVPRERLARTQADHSRLYEILGRAQNHFRQALKQAPEAIEYLKARGVSGLAARDFGIGFAPDAWDGIARAFPDVSEQVLFDAGLVTRNEQGRCYDRFRGRVMFPIRDTRGRVIAFGGRVMGRDDGPKYLNSPETAVFHKGRELYGLYEARRALRQIDRLIVVEGYMDVVALAQAGIANAVATLGTAATVDHFQKLYRYTDEVVCCFDGDTAGRQAAWRALESALPVLGEGRRLRFMFLPDGEDPDSLVRRQGREAFLAIAAEALPAVEYLFDQLAEGLDLRQLDDRARLASLAMPHIERASDPILTQLMRERLETLTGLRRGSTGPQSGARQPGRRDRNDAGVTRLRERLLRALLRRPGLVLALPPGHLEALQGLPGDDLLVDMVKYIAENPETDAVEVLGRWAGTDQHAVLVGLLGRPLDLEDGALQGEFFEGVDRYLGLRARSERRRLLAEVRQDASREKFAEFWARRREVKH
jgi:DNA primase